MAGGAGCTLLAMPCYNLFMKKLRALFYYLIAVTAVSYFLYLPLANAELTQAQLLIAFWPRYVLGFIILVAVGRAILGGEKKPG